MSHSDGGTSVTDLVAHIGDSVDVRAVLDLDPLPVAASLLPAIKLEVDRLAYADRRRAAQLVEAASWAADRLGDVGSRAFADASRARLLFAEARYGDAATLFSRAGLSLHTDGRALDAAVLAKQHMAALMYLGRYDESLAIAASALRTLRRSGDRRLLAEHETNLGNVYYQMDRYRKALGCYERARSIFATVGDRLSLAYIDHNCATVLVDLDRSEEALELYSRALAAYRVLGLHTLSHQVELAVAFVSYLKGHYSESLRRLHAAQESGEEILNDADAALTQLDLAAIYLNLNAFPEASRAANRAVEMFSRAEMARELGNARRLAAVASSKMGDDASAAATFEDVAREYDEAKNPAQAGLTRLELAAVALAQGKANVALNAASTARRDLSRAWLAPKRRLARLLEARALFELGDIAGASRVARDLVKASGASGDSWTLYQCHHLLARAQAARGRSDASLASYRAAIAAVERLRSRIVVDDFKTRFLEDKADLYEGAVASCLRGGTPELVADALRTLELAKSRSLSDLLSGYLRESVDVSDERSSKTRERFKRLVDELAWYTSKRDRLETDSPGDGARRHARRRGRELAACEARVAEAFQRLQIEDARFADLQSPRVVDPEDLQSLLRAHEALVEFATEGAAYSAIVVTKHGIDAVRLAPIEDVDRLLDGLRFQMDKFVYGRAFAAREIAHLRQGADLYLARLYDALIRPIEALVGNRDLIVVPYKRLHYVPMHALFDGEAYVVERRGVSYAPSATVYSLCARWRPRGDAPAGPPLLCGVADSGTPAIVHEIEALRELFPDAMVLTGSEATRGALAREATGRRVLHVASHAVFRSDNPMLSSLRLADGDLTFYDVFNLRLTADLVVLSGCHTGAVAIGAGDELHGLMRGFLYAGAPTLLISMWAADDSATAGLMRTFYSELNRGSGKRDALRTAQRTAIVEAPHPYYWAPFTLLGRPA